MRRLLIVLIALTLFGAACSDDSDSSDGDSTSTTADGDGDAGASDESDDDAGDDHEDGDDDAAEGGGDEPVNNAGGPPPGTELRLGGAGGTVIVTVDCIDPAPTGVVLFNLEGGESGSVVTVAVNTQTAPLSVGADGTGSQGIQTEVTDPSAITIDFGDSKQAGQLIGC